MDAKDEIRSEIASDVEAWRGEEHARASVSINFGLSRSRAELSMLGETVSAEGDDYFEALLAVRRELERRGWLIGIEGARLQSWPSGMMRDSASGMVYRLTLGAQATELRNVLDRAPKSEVATLADQEAFWRQWLGSLGT